MKLYFESKKFLSRMEDPDELLNNLCEVLMKAYQDFYEDGNATYHDLKKFTTDRVFTQLKIRMKDWCDDHLEFDEEN